MRRRACASVRLVPPDQASRRSAQYGVADVVAAQAPDNGPFDAPFGLGRSRRKHHGGADRADLEHGSRLIHAWPPNGKGCEYSTQAARLSSARDRVGPQSVALPVGGAASLASNAAIRALSASFSSRARRAISLTASNSSR